MEPIGDRHCITLVEGTRAALREGFVSAIRSAPDALVMVPPATPLDVLVIPLGGVRALVPVLRMRLSDEAVDAAMAPHRAQLSLVLRGMEPHLAPDEVVARSCDSPAVLGWMPGPALSPLGMLEAWAAVLASLIPAATGTWFIPDATALDPGSVTLVRMTLRRLSPADRPDVYVGVPLDATCHADAGRQRVAGLIAEELDTLRALPVTRVALVTESTDPVNAAPVDPDPLDRDPMDRDPMDPDPWAVAEQRMTLLDPLDDGLEARGATLIEAGHAVTAQETCVLLRTTRVSFGGYGFFATLTLAEVLLKRDPDHPAAAELHTLAGISALHLGQGQDDASRTLTHRAGEHLAAALDHEHDPVRRANLLFRLTVQATRALAMAQAVAAGDCAVNHAQAAGISPAWAPFVEAWCRIARAAPLAAVGRLRDARRDATIAFGLLDRCTDPDGPAAVDTRLARFHAATVLTRLACESGNREAARHWQATRVAIDEALPPARRAVTSWHDPALDLDDLAATSVRLAALYQSAVRSWEPQLAAVRAHDLAEVRFRRGDAAGARSLFLSAYEGLERTGSDARDRLAVWINAAVAAFRAGQFREARVGFDVALHDPLADDDTLRAVLHGGLARIAACLGETDTAERYAAAALALATQTADPVVIARVERLVGDTLGSLGRAGDARHAYQRGLAHLDAARQPAPEDRIGLCLGLYDTLGDDRWIREALHLCPAALADATAWWELPRLVAALAAAPGVLYLPAERAAVHTVLAAAFQRVDTAAAARRLAETVAAMTTPGHGEDHATHRIVVDARVRAAAMGVR